MESLVNENMIQNLTSPSLTFNGWLRNLKKQNILLHSHTDKFVRSYIRRAIKGGRVSANIKQFKSDKLEDIFKIISHDIFPMIYKKGQHKRFAMTYKR